MKRFGKNDMIFLGVLLLVCIAVLLVFSLGSGDKSGYVTVTRDGNAYGRYLLSEDQTVEITDDEKHVTNILVISDGEADMTEADCPDKLCVHQKPIRKAGENIVCLPNRIVVQVERAGEDGLDGFAQ